jgi:hypothetical protein
MLNQNYTIRCSLKEFIRIKGILYHNSGITPKQGIFRHHYKERKALKDFKISVGAVKIYKEPNAGGSSINSEALSADVLGELYNAKNIVTEMEIEYKVMNWKKCDYLANIYGQMVGVSVTRGMRYPKPELFDKKDAEKLLRRKLSGLISARDGIKKHHRFKKSILHIWCETRKIADILTNVYHSLNDFYKNNIVVILTITKESKYIYYDKLDLSLYKKFQCEILSNSSG